MTYQFFCENCGYKRITTGNDLQDLVEIKTSNIPRGAPTLDPITKKIVVPPSIRRKKIFKCPKCGFAIKAKELKEIKDESKHQPNGSETSPTGPEIS